MPNYAIVIGVNAYSNSSTFDSLELPVADAIRMAEWLIDPAKGRVRPDDLVLLLSPSEGEALDPILDEMELPDDRLAGIRELIGRRGPAEFDQIHEALQTVHRRAGDQGERLYFYYSGHGLSAAQDSLGNDVEDAIVPSDYGRLAVKRSISIPSIARTLLATSCREQFFFFDCCRNQLRREPIARVERLDPDRRRIPTNQYIYSATAMGLQALEVEGGFTDILLRGLAGAGGAKVFSRSSGAYEVRAQRLFEYLRSSFEKLPRATVGGAPGVPSQPQRPRLGGDHGEDPLLFSLAEAADVRLSVALKANPDVATGTPLAGGVQVVGEGLPVMRGGVVAAGTPLDFQLPPRFYMVVVEPNPSFLPPPVGGVDAYDDPCPHVVTLEPAPAPRRGEAPPVVEALPAAPPSAPAAVVIPPTSASLEALAAPPSPAAAPAQLSISAADPLAPLELLNSAGDVVRDSEGKPFVGLGRLECPGLAPGIYRARMQSPEGEISETIVAPGPGESIPVSVEPPQAARSGLVRRLAEELNRHGPAGRMIEASEMVKDIAMPAASTLISLASHATNRAGGWGGAGARLRGLGLDRFLRRDGDRPEGIQLFVGGEALAARPGSLVDPELAERLSTREGVARYLEELSVRIWPLGSEPGEASRLTKAGAVDTVASLSVPLEPGPYRLELRGPSHGGTAFSVVVLEDRTTELIVHQGADGRFDVSLFMPSGSRDAPPDPELIRLLDLLQRFLRNGDARFGATVTERLLRLPLLDPVAGALAGVLLHRAGRGEALVKLGKRLVGHYPGLPDGHVLLGLGRFQRDDPGRAIEAFGDALRRGLPILAPLLLALDDAVAALGPDAAELPRRPLLVQAADAVIPGLLWTAQRAARAEPAAAVL